MSNVFSLLYKIQKVLRSIQLLSMALWAVAALTGVGALSEAKAQAFVITPNSATGNTVLLSDGAFASNFDDQVRDVAYTVTGTNQITISYQWFPSTSGSYTETSGIHTKLFYHNGSGWSEIYSNRVVAANLAGKFNSWQNESYVFNIPSPSNGVRYIRASIIDLANSSDSLNQARGCGTCGTASVSDRHYDNADVSFTLAPPPTLSVSPGGPFNFSGVENSGSYTPTPQNFTVSNTGGGTLNYSVGTSQPWISVSSSSVNVTPTTPANVAVSINGNANSLAPGSYSGQVTFTNNTNGSGNTSRTINLTVTDGTPPVITAPVVPPTEATSTLGAIVSFAATAVDAVDPAPTITYSQNPGTTFPLGTTTVTVTATDASGNSSQANFDVTVVDTTPPAITPPGPQTVPTNPGAATATLADYTGSAVVTDIADAAPTITQSPLPGASLPLGANTITLTATDASGNSASATFTVTVIDTEPPALTPPGNIITNNDPAQAGAVVTFAATATDNSGAAPTITYSQNPGTLFPLGTTIVTVTATDAAGNTSTATFDVTVNDNENPTLALPANITQPNDPGQNTAIVTFAATATDNSGIPPTIVYSTPPGSAFPLGITVVTVTATDGDGNATSGTFTVTVIDNEAPVVTPPADITVNVDPGLPTAVVTFMATAVDNVGVVSLSSSPASGSAFPIGTTTVTVTATDAAGNIGTATFDVTVLDNEPPVINGLPANISVSVNFPDTSSVVTFTNPTVTDNAPGASIAQTAGLASGAAFPLGTTTNTFTATDASGNSVTASFTVTVTQVPPGEIVIRKESDVNDGTFRFSGSEPQFSFALTTNNGRAQSAPILIKPGTYKITEKLPDGFALTSGSCSDNNSTINISSATATIKLASGESVTCTFRSADTRTKTVQTIQRFLKRRNDLLLSNGPDTERQIDRLLSRSGTGGNGASGTGFASAPGKKYAGPGTAGGLTATGGMAVSSQSLGDGTMLSALGGPDGTDASSQASDPFGNSLLSKRSNTLDNPTRMSSLPLGFQVGGDNASSFSFATSLVQMANSAAEAKRRNLAGGVENLQALGIDGAALVQPNTFALDVWVQGHYASFDEGREGGESDGSFGVFYLGMDYVVAPNLLIGALVQYDHMKEYSADLGTRTEGNGWMAGPYMTLRATDNVFLQARAAWGRSDNDISPFLTYEDSFKTERWLVEGSVQGRWTYGNWSFNPKGSIAYIEENQEAYNDFFGVYIPGQTVTLGQARFGPRIGYMMTATDGTMLEPYVGIEGVWNFEESGTALVAATLASDQELRGKLDFGLRALTVNGLGVDLSGSYDGLGTAGDYEAISGEVRLRLPLQ